MKRISPPVRVLLFLGIVLALAGLAISCGTVSRTVVAPATIPGATYIGTTTCADCHDVLVRRFQTAAHARLQAPGEAATEIGCESCHGAGSLHNDSGGEPGTIINPRESPTICLNCHLNVRGTFQLPYHHPVPEGNLKCGDCHDPHEGPATRGGGTALLSANEACLTCHRAQQGPFVFEHEAMREGCTICHAPHGSVNAKLLTQRNATLCLRCHFQQQTSSGSLLIGGVNHRDLVQRGTCWSAGCHEAVHGSRVNSSLRY